MYTFFSDDLGDHKQLRPSAAVYELTTNYDFDVSLFERMINNGMYCPMLDIQHRMRPDISKLITPLIYKELKNHESVVKYEPVRGVCKNIFFLEHNEFEEEVSRDSLRQKCEEQLKILFYVRAYQDMKEGESISIENRSSDEKNYLNIKLCEVP
jgi:superfamily I DNA and/or RNA helicase